MPSSSTADPRVDLVTPDQTKRAKEYENKVDDVLGGICAALVTKEGTIADSAALLKYGPAVSRAWGNIADENQNVARVIDFISSGANNPYAMALIPTVALVAQLLRNHEDAAVDRPVEARLPFLKRTFKIRLKWRIKLRNPWIRSRTTTPDALVTEQFSDPRVMNAFLEQGIQPAFQPGGKKSNGATRRTSAPA